MKKFWLLLALLLPLFTGAQSRTPNYNLFLPATNSSNWGALINQNFIILDSALAGAANEYQGPWVSTTTYSTGQIVTYLGGVYLSIQNSNLNNTPSTSPSWWLSLGGGGSGTVSSVGLSMPSIFTVTNSPVTNTGILTATFNTQSANTIFAGPTTGSPAAPTFRTLVAADLPSLSGLYCPLTGCTYTGPVYGGSGFNFASSVTYGAFNVGALPFSDTGVLDQMTASVNGYLQRMCTNTSTGTAASCGFVTGNSNSTATTYFGEFGQNGSGFSGSANTFSAPNAVYLTSTSAELDIGSTTSNNVNFFYGSTAYIQLLSGGVYMPQIAAGTGNTYGLQIGPTGLITNTGYAPGTVDTSGATAANYYPIFTGSNLLGKSTIDHGATTAGFDTNPNAINFTHNGGSLGSDINISGFLSVNRNIQAAQVVAGTYGFLTNSAYTTGLSTPATSANSYAANSYYIDYNYWNGSASTLGTVSFQVLPLAGGTNTPVIASIVNSGSTGAYTFQLANANNSTTVNVEAGVSGTHYAASVYLSSQGGYSSGGWIVQDSATTFPWGGTSFNIVDNYAPVPYNRISFQPATHVGSASNTYINSGYTGAVIINGDSTSISGSGGLIVKTGYSSPSTIASFTSSYITFPNLAGASTYCLQVDSSGNLVNSGTATCGAGSAAWSGLGVPTGNLSLAMSTYTTAFSWSAQASPSTTDFTWTAAADTGSSTASIFSFTDTASNARTGPLVNINTASSSTALPLRVTAQGTANGISMNTSGVLAPIGTGAISANQINGSSVSSLTFTNPSSAATLTLAAGSTLQTTGTFTLNLTVTAATTPTFPTGSFTVAQLGAQTFTGKQTTLTSSTSGAGFSMPPGTAPTTPVSGDCWTTTTVGTLLQCYLGSTTYNFAALNAAQTFSSAVTFTGWTSTANNTISNSPAVSQYALKMGGTVQAGGTGTTSFPLMGFIQTGTAVTTWTAAGTELGFAPVSGYVGMLIDAHAPNGGGSVWKVNYTGAETVANPTAATVSTVSNAPAYSWASQFWNGTATTTDTITLTPTYATGTNGAATFTLAHSGTTGNFNFVVSALETAQGYGNPSSLTIAAGAGAGSSPTIACATNVVCGWNGGTVNVTTGTSPSAASTVFTVTDTITHPKIASCTVQTVTSNSGFTSATVITSNLITTLAANNTTTVLTFSTPGSTSLNASAYYQVSYTCIGQ